MEKIEQRDHYVSLDVEGNTKSLYYNYPDTVTGGIFSKLCKSHLRFCVVLEDIDHRLTKFLTWVFSGVCSFLMKVLVSILIMIPVFFLFVFIILPQCILKVYWWFKGYTQREFSSLAMRRDPRLINCQMDFEGMEDKITEIKAIVEKHLLISPEDMPIGDVSFLDKACNVAEERLQTGKPGAQLTQDLRKLIRLVDSLDED